MVNKPRTPNNDRTRLRDAFLIPAIFYLEITAAILAVLVLSHFFSRFVTISEYWVSFLIFGIVLAGLVQLGVKIKRNVKERGLPPWSVALVFGGTLLAPPAFVGAYLGSAGPPTKARQSEAKSALEAVFQGEREFKAQFKKYSLSIREAGYAPEGELRLYAVGFASACAVLNGLAPERSMLPTLNSPWAEKRKRDIDLYFLNVRRAEDCLDPAEGFEAFAVGVIRENGPLDIWRIDDKRKLENIQPGF